MAKGEETIKTRIAVLGTLSEFHKQPIKYDLACLYRLIEELEPDLLCAEIRREDWESGDLSHASVEYRDSIVPLWQKTDIVIVPIDGPPGSELVVLQQGPLLGLRSHIVSRLNDLLGVLQRIASGPRAINSGLFGALCHSICSITALVCGKQTHQSWKERNRKLLQNILWTVQHDPGRRILVTVDCRRKHLLDHELRKVKEVELVHFWKL